MFVQIQSGEVALRGFITTEKQSASGPLLLTPPGAEKGER